MNLLEMQFLAKSDASQSVGAWVYDKDKMNFGEEAFRQLPFIALVVGWMAKKFIGDVREENQKPLSVVPTPAAIASDDLTVRMAENIGNALLYRLDARYLKTEDAQKEFDKLAEELRACRRQGKRVFTLLTQLAKEHHPELTLATMLEELNEETTN